MAAPSRSTWRRISPEATRWWIKGRSRRQPPRLAGGTVTLAAAATAIGIAAAVNTGVKAGFTVAIGRKGLGFRVVVVLGAAVVAGVVAWASMHGTPAPEMAAPAPSLDQS